MDFNYALTEKDSTRNQAGKNSTIVSPIFVQLVLGGKHKQVNLIVVAIKQIFNKITIDHGHYFSATFSIISIKHFVALFNKSIFANSLGECILLGKTVLPMQIESTDRSFLKLYIGPVPGDEIFKITSL